MAKRADDGGPLEAVVGRLTRGRLPAQRGELVLIVPGHESLERPPRLVRQGVQAEPRQLVGDRCQHGAIRLAAIAVEQVEERRDRGHPGLQQRPLTVGEREALVCLEDGLHHRPEGAQGRVVEGETVEAGGAAVGEEPARVGERDVRGVLGEQHALFRGARGGAVLDHQRHRPALRRVRRGRRGVGEEALLREGERDIAALRGWR